MNQFFLNLSNLLYLRLYSANNLKKNLINNIRQHTFISEISFFFLLASGYQKIWVFTFLWNKKFSQRITYDMDKIEFYQFWAAGNAIVLKFLSWISYSSLKWHYSLILPDVYQAIPVISFFRANVLSKKMCIS